MGSRGVVLVLAALVCLASGFLVGRLSAPPQTVLHMPQQDTPTPEPEAGPSQLGAALAALGSCVDRGPSPMDAPHFCRWGDDAVVGVAVHWWGDLQSPSRAYVAFSVGRVDASNVVEAVELMIDLAVAFTNAFVVPGGFWEQVTPASPEASFRNATSTVTVHEHRHGSRAPHEA